MPNNADGCGCKAKGSHGKSLSHVALLAARCSLLVIGRIQHFYYGWDLFARQSRWIACRALPLHFLSRHRRGAARRSATNDAIESIVRLHCHALRCGLLSVGQCIIAHFIHLLACCESNDAARSAISGLKNVKQANSCRAISVVYGVAARCREDRQTGVQARLPGWTVDSGWLNWVRAWQAVRTRHIQAVANGKRSRGARRLIGKHWRTCRTSNVVHSERLLFAGRPLLRLSIPTARVTAHVRPTVASLRVEFALLCAERRFRGEDRNTSDQSHSRRSAALRERDFADAGSSSRAVDKSRTNATRVMSHKRRAR